MRPAVKRRIASAFIIALNALEALEGSPDF